MKLCKDTSPGAYAVRVPCVECGRKYVRLADAWADTEGRPFVDYYCGECAAQYIDAPRFIDGKEV